MKKPNFKKLDQLVNKLDNARRKYESAQSCIVIELQKLTGKNIVHSDFSGDGIGVMVAEEGSEHSVNNYMSVDDMKKLIAEKGTVDYDDFTYL